MPTRQDTAAEPNETFTVTLSSPSGATLRDAGAVGTIIDDDAPDPVGPALTVSDAKAREGEILRFQVILTPPGSDTPVTVDYQTATGTAVEGLDYIAAGGSLTFKPGIAQQTVEVQTRKDDIDESNETLTLRLSNAYAARLQDAVGIGTIIGTAERRIRLLNRAYLPEVGRAIAFNAVRCRIDRALSRTASGNLKQALDRLAPPPPASFGLSPARSRSVSIDQLLGRLSFSLQSTGGANGIGRVSAWSCGDYRALAGGKSGGPVDWDGKVVGLQAGADVRLRPDLVAGLAFSPVQRNLPLRRRRGGDRRPAPPATERAAPLSRVEGFAASDGVGDDRALLGRPRNGRRCGRRQTGRKREIGFGHARPQWASARAREDDSEIQG